MDVKLIQRVEKETMLGYKCKVSYHKKLYYCGLWSYAKPILSAETEEAMVITAESCGEMTRTKTFITPQTRKSEPVTVPGRTYIMEFDSGFQTTSNSEIRCQGQEMLMDGQIMSGIVSHVEYQITIEKETFARTGTEIVALSSAEKLACNPHGPREGCVGALHTYTWKPPATTCEFKIVREVTGLLNPKYFAADEEQLFYEVIGEHNLPTSCGGGRVLSTNVQDIMIMRNDQSKNHKLQKIKAEDVLYAAEIRSLALYLRFKLELIEGSRTELGKQISCEENVKEPAEAPPHRIEAGRFVFRRGDGVYEYNCQEVVVGLKNSEKCYNNVPIEPLKGYKFINLANRMLTTESAEEPCTPNFSRLVQGMEGWIRVGPELRIVPAPRSEVNSKFSLSHHEDELGLYTEAEERDFDHISNLRGYTDQVTSSLVHAICTADDECDLNRLPGSPSYSLTNLERETATLIELGPWEYFLTKILAPILQALHLVAAGGGLITACTWAVWAGKAAIRTGWICCGCCKVEEPRARFSPEMLVELMGDSMSLPHRNPPGGARYSKKEERVLLDLPADSRP